jgi:hypothetical protein
VFTESLTLRILGDSSGLRRELDDVLGRLDSFRHKVADLSSAGQQLAKAFTGLGAATNPLQGVSKLLTQITQQVRTLGQTPLSLNVQPALNALQRLAAAIEAIAARLRAIAVFPVPGRPVTPAPPAVPPFPPKYGAGGLVTGPAGLDRVPAFLTAGEFVLNRQAVASLGADLLHTLNTAPPSQPAVSSSSSTTNHFGGISINVRETADVNGLVRDLRLQGIHLRNRRG